MATIYAQVRRAACCMQAADCFSAGPNQRGTGPRGRFQLSLVASMAVTLVALAPAHAQPGDLVLPLPPDYTQVRNGLPQTAGGTPGGAYCGPTSCADLLKWMNLNGWPEVGTWGDSTAAVTTGIANLGILMATDPDNGTTTTNMMMALQFILDVNYPGQFDVGYIGRLSASAVEQDLGRNLAWLALHLEFGHLCVANIGWYDLPEGTRCGGHYVAMAGYDHDGDSLWARFRDPARDTNATTVWDSSYELLDLDTPDGGIEPAWASRWVFDRPGNTCSNNETRTPVQDGFVYIGGVRLFSRPPTFTTGFISMTLSTGQSSSHAAPSGPAPTSLAVHPSRFELYCVRPSENKIFVTDLKTNTVKTLSTTAALNQPRRLALGSDAVLYLLQGTASQGFTLLAIRPDGGVAGSATQSTLGAIAYHEKLHRVYWWTGPSNQLRVFSSTLQPIGSPIQLPTGPTFVDPGYMAADPTGDLLYFNHNGTGSILRYNVVTHQGLTAIGGGNPDPSNMAVDNRGHLFVAPASEGPVIEYDRDGVLVTSSAAGAFKATDLLAMTRAVRTPLSDPNEQNAFNLNVDSVDCLWTRGDFDCDIDTDADDLVIFEACATGPAIPYNATSLPSGCALQADSTGIIPADRDADHDVDHADFGHFQRCFSGENLAADPNCAD
jgi:hypothetical protein